MVVHYSLFKRLLYKSGYESSQYYMHVKIKAIPWKNKEKQSIVSCFEDL